MIEPSDLTDQKIIEATMLNTSAEGGGCRFEYNLPLGGKVTSEWADDVLQLKRGMMKWVETCRAAHVDQLKEDQARQRRDALMRLDADKAPVVEPVRESRQSPVVGPDQDPLDYVRAQIALLDAEVSHWALAVTDASAKYEGALKARKRWDAALYGLENGPQ